MKKFDISNKTYEEQNHFYGRIWGIAAIIVLSIYPVICGIVFNAWPDFKDILACMGTIAIFWLAGIVEVFTYVPMLGAVSGGYLGFVTGNLSNLKVPCALSCMEGANVKSGTAEGEVVAIISTAVSSIVTVLVIAIGVCLMIPFSEQLSNPVLDPAFNNVLPALFGALGVVFVSKNWKIALPPILLMAIIFVAVSPFFNVYGYASVLIPVSAIFTMVIARAMYKKGLLSVKPEAASESTDEVAESADEATEVTTDTTAQDDETEQTAEEAVEDTADIVDDITEAEKTGNDEVAPEKDSTDTEN